jgi:hypothetical protein
MTRSWGKETKKPSRERGVPPGGGATKGEAPIGLCFGVPLKSTPPGQSIELD